jgi:hypothetical protein
MLERLKALPTLESWKRIAQRVRDPGHGELDLAWPLVVESVDGAEENLVGNLTQYQQERILSNISHLTLGGEAAANAHVVTCRQQRQNEEQNLNEINEPNSETNKEAERVR